MKLPKFYERALANRVPGSNSGALASVLNSLAGLYQAQGRYQEAKALYEEALEIHRRSGSPEQIAATLNNLASLYQVEGNYAKAEAFYKEALQIEKMDGGDDLNTALRLTDLATVYQAQGRYAEAEVLYQQALAIQQRAGSPRESAATLNSLATLYQTQGRDEEAETARKAAAATVSFGAHAQNWPEIAASLAQEAQAKICNLQGMQWENGRPKPTNREQRVALYLRCEARGAGDEWIGQSCCEHLTQPDSESIGRCPTTWGGPWMAAFRNTVTCP